MLKRIGLYNGDLQWQTFLAKWLFVSLLDRHSCIASIAAFPLERLARFCICSCFSLRDLSALDEFSVLRYGYFAVIMFKPCVAWWFISNLSALGKRGSRDNERQSREEPGKETTEKPSPLCELVFKLLKRQATQAIMFEVSVEAANITLRLPGAAAFRFVNGRCHFRSLFQALGSWDKRKQARKKRGRTKGRNSL